MNSSIWMKALEKFDRDFDINSMTRKEVKINLRMYLKSCLIDLF